MREKEILLDIHDFECFLSQQDCQKFAELLTKNNDSLDDIIVSFVKEYILFGYMPILEYHKAITTPSAHGFDFSVEPLSRIHPLKRMAVSAILSSGIPPTIERIIVFGSSVTLRCHEQSDFDLCIIGEFNIRKNEKDMQWLNSIKAALGPTDLKIYTAKQFQENGWMRSEIKKNGVVIYEAARNPNETSLVG